MKRKSYTFGDIFDNVISSFVFRFYILIILVFVGVGVGLDFVLYHAQKDNTEENRDSPIVNAVFDYSNQWIKTHSTLPLEKMGAELSQQFNLSITLIPSDGLHLESSSASLEPSIITVHYENGAMAYLKKHTAHELYIQLGPMPSTPHDERKWVSWVSIVYYVMIIFIVTAWFLPLRRDLKILSDSLNEFSEDYRRPLRVLKKVTGIKGLASNIEKMANQIRHLIQGHKELTGAVSHELRTPIARMKFSLENLLEDNKKLAMGSLSLAEVHDLGGASREELLSIKEDVGDLDQLIDAMLNYTKLDHPEMRIDAHNHRINEWVAPILAKFSSRQTTVLTTQLSTQLGTASFDAYLLEMAVSNLLVNAFRYAQSEVRLSCTQTNAELVIHIEDDGQGIPPCERSNIFRAFTRLDVSRNRETGGYGLGLAIVRRIMLLHHGSVRVAESSLGGAQFTLTLPVVK